MESFDIFDTVLTRSVGDPASVFLLMGKKLNDRLLVAVSPPEFARLRIEAEARARRNCGWGEVTLETIHKELCALLGLKETECQEVMRLECDTEESLLRTVPGAVDRISDAGNRHGRVIYVSDMYLPRRVIHGWLERHELWRDRDRLYLSNEAGVSKATGQLFGRVLAEEQLSADSLIHHGNHPQSDMTVPARMGIHVRPFPEGNLNRYETIMESHAASTGGLSSVLAGASRLARLSVHTADETGRTIRDVSAGVMAPLLAGYVLWVLRRARELSLRRVYFVSRDGQIMLEIARRLAPKLNLKIDLRYLYGSRQSWHLPGITKIDAAKLEWICIKYDFLSIRSLLYRVGLSPEDVAGEITKVGLYATDWDRQLTAEEIERVKPLLLEGPIHDMVLSQASAKRALLLGYLQQEGVLEDDSWALVDLGWNGRMQASLGEVLVATGGPYPRGFYYGLEQRPAAPGAGAFEAYLFDPSNPSLRRRLSTVNLATLMEIACAADHGSVEGFVRNEGRIEPVLRGDTNGPVIEWGLPVVHETICRFADHLVLDGQLLDIEGDLRPAAAELVCAFWQRPTRREAEVWGRFPFENDQSGTAFRPIAEPYGAGTVVRAILGQQMGSQSASFWQEGSVMISPPPVRIVLRCGLKVKRFLRESIQGARG